METLTAGCDISDAFRAVATQRTSPVALAERIGDYAEIEKQSGRDAASRPRCLLLYNVPIATTLPGILRVGKTRTRVAHKSGAMAYIELSLLGRGLNITGL